jgi:hypothetical protein
MNPSDHAGRLNSRTALTSISMRRPPSELPIARLYAARLITADDHPCHARRSNMRAKSSSKRSQATIGASAAMKRPNPALAIDHVAAQRVMNMWR